MVFEANIDEFQDACTKLKDIEKEVFSENDKAKNANNKALKGNAGEWRENAVLEFLSIQGGLTALDDGLKNLEDSCKSALSDLQGDLSKSRQAVFDAVDRSPSDTKRIYCDASADYGSSVEDAQTMLGNSGQGSFGAKVADAISECAGLDNAGGEAGRISMALDTLQRRLPQQSNDISEVADAWNGYKSVVDNFNSTYAGAFSGTLVTQESLKSARENVVADGIEAASKTKNMKNAKNMLSALQKYTQAGLDAYALLGWESPKLLEEANAQLDQAIKSGNFSKENLDKCAEFAKKLMRKDSFKEFAVPQGHRKYQLAQENVGAAGKLLGKFTTALNIVGVAEDIWNAFNLTQGDTDTKISAASEVALKDGVSIAATTMITDAIMDSMAGAAGGSTVGVGGTIAGVVIGAIVGILVGAVVDK